MAEEPLGALVEEHEPVLGVHREDPVRGEVEDVLEPGLGLGPAPLRLLQAPASLAELHLAQLVGLQAHRLRLLEEVDEDPDLGA